jgi:prevent-host-death family protein
MHTLTLAETKSRLSAVVDQVEAGDEVVITRRGRPVARIVGESSKAACAPGALAEDLRAFVLSQSASGDHSVVSMRAKDRY